MKKLVYILCIIAILTSACNKNNQDQNLTRVGFYVKNNTHTIGDQAMYSLYIDDVYAGPLYVLPQEPSDTSLLLFQHLDATIHYIDVKDTHGQWISANYLQITSQSTKSGSATRGKQISGINGATYQKNNDKPYAIYAALQ